MDGSLPQEEAQQQQEEEEVGTHHGLFRLLNLCAESDAYWRNRVADGMLLFAKEARKCWPPSYRDECAKCRAIACRTLPATVPRADRCSMMLVRRVRRIGRAKRMAAWTLMLYVSCLRNTWCAIYMRVNGHY